MKQKPRVFYYYQLFRKCLNKSQQSLQSTVVRVSVNSLKIQIHDVDIVVKYNVSVSFENNCKRMCKVMQIISHVSKQYENHQLV